MGIHDRPYARPDAQPPVHRRPGGWSVTTWIIALCAAVFVVDGFLPVRLEAVRSEPLVGIDPARLAEVRPSEFTRQPPESRVSLQGVATLGDQPVAIVDYRPVRPIESIGYFSTAKAVWNRDPVLGASGFEVWRVITVQFLHANLNHLWSSSGEWWSDTSAASATWPSTSCAAPQGR